MIDKIMNFLQKPQEISVEGERFAQYCESWKEKRSLLEVWQDTEINFFPLEIEHPLFRKLHSLNSDDIDTYIKILSLWNIPYPLSNQILRDYFNCWDKILDLLAKSPDSIENGFDWNGLALTPIVLDSAFHILKTSPEFNWVKKRELNDDDRNEIEDKIRKIALTLRERKDGFFLAYNYVEYLTKKIVSLEIKKFTTHTEINEILLAVFSEIFNEDAKQQFVADGYINLKSLTSYRDTIVKDFRYSGSLWENASKEDPLIQFIVRNYFMEPTDSLEAKKCFEDFCCIFASNAWSFFTYDFKQYYKHYDIAKLFVAQDNLIKAWRYMWDFMSSARNKVAFHYHNDESSNLRYHFNFMRSVSLRILDLLISDGKIDKSLLFWSELWDEALMYTRKFAFFHEKFDERYLCFLLVYRWILLKSDGDKRRATNMLMEKLRDIDNFADTVLQAVIMLDDNGLSFKEFIAGENEESNRKFFCDIFQAAQYEIKNEFQIQKLKQYTELIATK